MVALLSTRFSMIGTIIFLPGGDRFDFKPAVSLDQSQYGLLFLRPSFASLVISPTDIGFVHFNARKHRTFRGFFHCLSDSVAEIPSGLVANFESALKLIGRHAFFTFRHEVDGEEPLPKGQVGIVEDRPGRDGELIATSQAIKPMASLCRG